MECELLYYLSLQNNDFILLPVTKILFYHSISLEYPNNGMEHYSIPLLKYSNNGVEQLYHSISFHSTTSYFISFHSTIYYQSKHTLSVCSIMLSREQMLKHFWFKYVLCNALPSTVLHLSRSTTLRSCYCYLSGPCLTATSSCLQCSLNYPYFDAKLASLEF